MNRKDLAEILVTVLLAGGCSGISISYFQPDTMMFWIMFLGLLVIGIVNVKIMRGIL